MTSRLETENEEIEPQMHNAGVVGAELRNEENEAPENGEVENEEPVNDEPKNTEPPHSQVPEDPPPRSISEVSTPTTSLQIDVLETPASYALAFRHNRGKPPNRYSLDEEERRSKYPIANYVSTQNLSEPLKTFTQTLSSFYIPRSVEEVLLNLKWAQAIQEELEALQKNNTWKLVPLPKGKKVVGCK